MQNRMLPPDAQLLANQAEEAMREGNFAVALALWDQVIEQIPRDPSLRAGRADALLQLGSLAEALDEAGRAAQADPELLSAQWVRAVAAAQLGRKTLADDAFQRSVTLSDGDGLVLAEYAHFLAAQRDPDAAEAIALRAVGREPSLATGWSALGYAQLRQKRIEDAETSLKRALELDPHDARAKAYLAMLMDRTGREKTADALERLLEEECGREVAHEIRQPGRARRLASFLFDRKVFEGRRRAIMARRSRSPQPIDEPHPPRHTRRASRRNSFLALLAALVLMSVLLLVLLEELALVVIAVLVPAALIWWSRT